MKKLNNPKIFFGLAGFVFVGGFGLCFMAFSNLQSASQKLDILRNETKKEKDVKKELEEQLAKLKVLEAELTHIEKGVPTFAYLPTMLKDLEIVGRSNGIDVLGIRPVIMAQKSKDDKEKKKAYEELPISVKGRGTFGNTMRFIQALNKFPKIVGVKMLNMVPRLDPQNPGDSPKLDVEIELKAFAFKDAQPTAKVEKVAMKSSTPRGKI